MPVTRRTIAPRTVSASPSVLRLVVSSAISPVTRSPSAVTHLVASSTRALSATKIGKTAVEIFICFSVFFVGTTEKRLNTRGEKISVEQQANIESDCRLSRREKAFGSGLFSGRHTKHSPSAHSLTDPLWLVRDSFDLRFSLRRHFFNTIIFI